MFIDLSIEVRESTPVYPGDAAPKFEAAGTLANDGFADHVVTINNHLGTHIDAPAHMIEGGATLGSYPIDRFIGPAICLKGFDDLSGVQEGDIVLFSTGMGSKLMLPDYWEDYPAMTAETAKKLVDLKVKMVGVDAGSVDNQDGFPIHKTLLAGGVLIIENLADLSSLEGKRFKLYALPLKLNIDGAPARVVAELS